MSTKHSYNSIGYMALSKLRVCVLVLIGHPRWLPLETQVYIKYEKKYLSEIALLNK
jgi:hypothetical protein